MRKQYFIILKLKWENFLSFAKDKNLRLKPSKLQIGEQVTFGGAVISAELVKNEKVVCVLPKDQRNQAFYDLKKPQSKKDIQSFCGMLASLQQWHPNIPINIPMLRKAAGSRSKVAQDWFPALLHMRQPHQYHAVWAWLCSFHIQVASFRIFSSLPVLAFQFVSDWKLYKLE